MVENLRREKKRYYTQHFRPKVIFVLLAKLMARTGWIWQKYSPQVTPSFILSSPPPHHSFSKIAKSLFSFNIMTEGKYARIPSSLKPAGTHSSELLKIERQKASFDSDQMSEYLHGKDQLEKEAELVRILESDPSGAFDKSKWNYMGRADKFRHALKKDKRLSQLAREHDWDRETTIRAESLCDLPGPFGLHRSMFITTIENMGTDEQKEKWLGPALRYEIIGCYAQTELGHGSNVQGLETLAVYDEEKQEYDLHSPTMTASKMVDRWFGKNSHTCSCDGTIGVEGQTHRSSSFHCPNS
jgi:Acyl-coenzyme A oxidase N-terminal